MSETVECRNASPSKYRARRSRAWGAAFATATPERQPSNVMSSVLKGIMKKYPLLTAEEESEMIAREPVTWRELLVLHNASLVLEKAKKWSGLYRYQDVDDMIQCGLMGLWKAAKKFEPTRGLRFSTYAGYWAEREMKEQARRVSIEVDAKSDSLNRKTEMDDEEGGEMLDYIQPVIEAGSKEKSLEEWLELRDEVEVVREIIYRLQFRNERHRACYIRLRQFGQEPEAQKVVARDCGLSRQRVNFIVGRIDGIVRSEVRRLDRMPRIQTTNWDRMTSVKRSSARMQTTYDRNLAMLIAYERYKLGIRKLAPLMVREERGPEVKSEGFKVKRLVVKGEKFVFKGGKWVPAPKEEDYGY